MKPIAVVWFEIYVDDMDRARAFYAAVLGVALERLPGTELDMWAFPGQPEAAGAAGALVRMEGFSAGGNSTRVYCACLDCAVEESRVAPSGGKVHRSKMSIGPYGFTSLVVDTEGNLFGLHSMQ